MGLKQHARKARTALRRGIIPPEIVADAFYSAIVNVAANPSVRTILEVGASSGAGSTEALVEGALRNPAMPVIHAIEISPPRYRALVKRYRERPFVKPHNVSSVAVERFPSEQQVREFFETVESPMRRESLSTVIGWLRRDVETVVRAGLSEDGIRRIKESEEIETFDMVLLDGSEFTGSAELEDVYGSRFILLDDIRTFKNYANHARLSSDPAYRLLEQEPDVRNGYAVFALKTD
jgi:hypothetical protein